MRKIVLLTAIFFAVIFSACTTAYIPTEENTPAFHKQNEFKGDLSYGSSGANLHAGYSFYKNFAAVGEISYLRIHSGDPEFQRNWGFGIGYFDKIKTNDEVYYEVLSGFNIAETRSSYPEQFLSNGPGYENSKYYKIYIQPDISFPFDFTELIFSIRFNYMKFSEYEHHTVKNPELPVALGMEPAFTFRMGSQYIKLKFQIGLSYIGLLSGSDFNSNTGFGHVGIDFSF